MRLIVAFARAYPRQSLVALLALIVAGAVEGISLTALLPVFAALFASGPSGHVIPPGFDGPGRFVMGLLERIGFTPSVGVLLGVVVVGVAARSALGLIARRSVGYTVAQVGTDLRLDLLRALLAARWEYFLRQPIGKLANAMSLEAQRAAKSYMHGATMMAALVQLVAYTWVALLVSPGATLAYVAAALVITSGLRGLVRASRRSGRKQTRLQMSLLASMTDSLQSVKPLKAMAREELADAVLAAQTNALNRAVRKEVLSKEALKASQDPLFLLLVIAAGWVALRVWALPLAEAVVLIGLLARVLGGFGKVQTAYQEVVACESAYWSLRATIDGARAQVEPMAGTRAPHFERAIRLEGVRFAYEEAVVLDELALEIPAGAFTTLVGFSGAGKTTIVDLVVGLLRPQGGRVWVDDVPLDEVDLTAWRRTLGYVPQENLLLHDSVLHNVTLGDPGLGEADAERALRAAGAWDFVARLPAGLATPVGERGAAFSGGQRQRIMIARALVHQPRLLILDEATSALDPESAAALADTLRGLRGRITILAISHQADLIDAADRVYRLEKGRATRVDGPAAALAPPRTALS